MIDAIKTKLKFNRDVNSLKPHNAVKIIWLCDECGIEKIKRYDEAIAGSGLCQQCSRKKIGKILGDQYGKQQTKTAYYCLTCNTFLAYSIRLKYCSNCLTQHKSALMKGSNNPVWTGKSLCKCGQKKSTNAINCRACSFKSGKRSGSNNGRWEPDRGKIIASRTARSILGNVMKLLGKKKLGKTVSILKYTFADFKKHFETQFEPWMNWNNRGNKLGTWSVDHIIPVSVLINKGITDPGVINALWNLRPICSIKNIQRGNIIDNEAVELAQRKLNITLTIGDKQ